MRTDRHQQIAETPQESCPYGIVRARLTMLLASCLLLACDASGTTDTDLTDIDTDTNDLTPDTVEPENSLAIGQVRSIEVAGVSLTSLPDTAVSVAPETEALGRLLFWDPILSGDMDIACGTCHLPEFGYSDGRALSIGTGGVGTGPSRMAGQLNPTSRNAPSVLNTAWNGINEFGLFDAQTAPMFWDNRTQSLTSQALEPISAQEEMLGTNFTQLNIEVEVVNRLSTNSEYRQLFQNAFGTDTITYDQIGQALADFQTTLIANNSPFDLWMRGDENAMSQQQLDGMQVFAETGCAECHSGPMFSDFDTHVLGVREAEGLQEPDVGDSTFAFRTPSLRQLAFTAPYFHGGQESSLGDVIEFYDNPTTSENPNVQRNQLDQDFLALPNLNNNQSNAIEDFLDALNDDNFEQTRPQSVPSGLPVGGSL